MKDSPGIALSPAHAKTIAASEEPSAPPWLKHVALLTGLLAALGGFLTVRSTNLSNEAIYHSNQGVLRQAKASDAWSEYQFNSVKAHIDETQLMVLADDSPKRAKLDAEDKELRARQPALMANAQQMEKERDGELSGGEQRLGEKDLLGYAGMAGQLGIALASVAALTRKKVAYLFGACFGGIGIVITAYALAMTYLMKS